MARGADLANGVVERIAEAHGVTPAQVILRWHIENGTIIIPKSVHAERQRENLDLFNIALPRVRDFRGINPNAFDGRGNYAMGLKEQLIFPEIEYDKVDKIRGMDICICTTATTDEEAKELLTMVGAPFYA